MQIDFVKPPKIGRLFYKDLIFKIPEKENRVYLTFDDGPNPETTPFILETLAKHKAKATFFCLGKNVELYPNLYQRIIEEGHGIGNHGYNHLNGWKTKTKEYLEDIKKASEFIDSKLFRPPYGKLKVSQIKELKKVYQLVLWDVSAQDYRNDISTSQIELNVINSISGGSIVVLHDNLKAIKNLKNLLSNMLLVLSKMSYIDKKLPFS